jgi:hypothetical protein
MIEVPENVRRLVEAPLPSLPADADACSAGGGAFEVFDRHAANSSRLLNGNEWTRRSGGCAIANGCRRQVFGDPQR